MLTLHGFIITRDLNEIKSNHIYRMFPTEN